MALLFQKLEGAYSLCLLGFGFPIVANCLICLYLSGHHWSSHGVCQQGVLFYLACKVVQSSSLSYDTL